MSNRGREMKDFLKGFSAAVMATVALDLLLMWHDAGKNVLQEATVFCFVTGNIIAAAYAAIKSDRDGWR